MSTLLPRPRLLDRIGAKPTHHVVLEAGGGFGKTVLASQLRSHVTDGCVVIWRASGTHDPTDLVTALAAAFGGARFELVAELITNAGPSAPALAAAVEHAGPVVVVIDGVHEWQTGAQALLAETIALSSSQARFVLLTRSLSAPLRDLCAQQDAMTFSADDLAFTNDEVIELARARSDELVAAAEVLTELTGGWPVAVHLLLERLASADNWSAELSVLGSTPEPASVVLRRYIGDLTSSDREMMLTLAALPAFDEGLVSAGGRPGLIERLIASGLPLAQRFDRRWDFCGSVRDLLLIHSPERPGVNTDVVRYLVAEREVKPAIDYCLNLGAHELAAEVIASLQIRDDILLDLQTLNRAMSIIGGAARDTPRSLLVQARANLSAMQFEVGLEALETAERCFEDIDPNLTHPDHLETKMDLALTYGFVERIAEATELIDRCEPVLGTESSVARAIMLEAKSVAMVFDQSDQARREAEQYLTEAIGVWQEVNEPRGAMSATLNLANNVLLPQARYVDAIEILDAAAGFRPVSIMNRARLALARGMILPLLGRATEARTELDRAIRLAKSIGQDWLAGWGWWKVATLCSLTGDDVGLVEAIETGRELAGNAVHHQSWIILHGGAVEAWLRSGHPDNVERANGHIDAMEQATEKTAWDPTYARWLIDARCGDAAAAARSVHELLSRAEAPRNRRWFIELYAAYAFHRQGDTASATEWKNRAAASAQSLGAGSIIELVERDLASELAAERVDLTSLDGVAPAVEDHVDLRMFGSFAVTVNGREIELPGGHVSNVIKLVALDGEPVHAEVLIDRLWPDADVQLGRKRLRNVLLRARNAGADFVDRRGDLLLFTENVGCDLWRARVAARAALSAKEDDSVVALCERAIELLGGGLLPGNRYDDWAEDARLDVALLELAVQDRLATLHIASGHIDNAVLALKRASDLDPSPNSRLQRCAELLRDAGRLGAAAQFERVR